jgi:hypothetical protein
MIAMPPKPHSEMKLGKKAKKKVSKEPGETKEARPMMTELLRL